MKREVVVVAGCRTAQGTFGGTLRDVPAHTLVQTPLLEVVKRAGVPASEVDNVIIGQVYQTSQALNIGRYCATPRAGRRWRRSTTACARSRRAPRRS